VWLDMKRIEVWVEMRRGEDYVWVKMRRGKDNVWLEMRRGEEYIWVEMKMIEDYVWVEIKSREEYMWVELRRGKLILVRNEKRRSLSCVEMRRGEDSMYINRNEQGRTLCRERCGGETTEQGKRWRWDGRDEEETRQCTGIDAGGMAEMTRKEDSFLVEMTVGWQR
jgi:hypothetical protein